MLGVKTPPLDSQAPAELVLEIEQEHAHQSVSFVVTHKPRHPMKKWVPLSDEYLESVPTALRSKLQQQNDKTLASAGSNEMVKMNSFTRAQRKDTSHQQNQRQI